MAVRISSPDRYWVVYVLKDPRDAAPRYVGWTVNERARLRDHLKPSALAKAKFQRRASWLATLVSLGMKPEMVVLERGAGDGWRIAEKKWIRHFRDAGCDLTNSTEGGEGTPGFRHSDASRAQMSEKRKGSGPSPQAHAAKLAAIVGKERPRAVMEPMWAARRQWRMPDAQRQKLSEIAQRRTYSAETRAKLSAAGMGRPGPTMSEAARAKLSAERKGKPAPGISNYWNSLGPEERVARQQKIIAVRRKKRASRDLFD